MPINRAPFNALVDDSGAGTDGTPWNKTQIKDVVLDPADAAYADKTHAAAHAPGGADPITNLRLALLAFSQSVTLSQNTVDGSDDRFLHVTPGGAADKERAGHILLFANEVGGAGGVIIEQIGNVSGAFWAVRRGLDAADVLRIETMTGLVSLLFGQLKFPATPNPSTDPNTDDDYKEGAWTVVDTSGQGLSITPVVAANYVKKAQICEASFYVTFPTTANAAAVTLGGLAYNPFGGYGGGFITHSTKGTGMELFLTGGNTIYLKDLSGNPLTWANMSGVTLSATLLFRTTS